MKLSFVRLILFALLLSSRCSQAAVYQESGGQVVIEAEHFDSRTTNASGHAFLIVPTEDPGAGPTPFINARGDVYTQVLPDNGGAGGANIDPLVRFRVNISTVGTYQLYLRWGGFDGGSDSVYAGLVGFTDGTGGTVADWYRYARTLTANSDFNGGWHGAAGFERTDAGGNDVAATWVISSPGLYTIQLSQREDGASVDALSFQLSTLPAPTDPGPSESAISTTFPVAVSGRTPGANAVGVFPDTSITVQIADGGSTQLNPNSIALSLNGTALSNPVITKSGNTTTITAAVPALLPAGSVNSVSVIFSDNASPAKTSTNTWSFTVENYATLTPGLARPAGTVDTASSGFSGTVYQARTDSLLPNSIQRAENQLRGLLIDPLTGARYVNHATVTNFTDQDVINWNRDAGGLGNEIGNFRADSAPPFPDEPIPGIPGDEASYENIAAELISYLDLPAGLIRLGVNSDDNFRVASAVNPRDAGLQLGTFDLPGGRGSADTIFSVFVQTAGIYPVRLVWEQGQGGANLEFFSVDIATGQKILINDRNNPKAIKAYRVSTFVLPPLINQIRPLPGAINAFPQTDIFVELVDQTSPVNSTTVAMTFNGSAVTPQVAKSGSSTKISFDPPGLLPSGSTNDVTLTYSDNAGVSYTNTWQFVVQNYSTLPTLPPDRKLTSVDTTKPGFQLRLRLLPLGVARPGGNTVATAILQLDDAFIDPATGQPYPDQINRSAAGNEPGAVFNPDGTFTEPTIVNFNEAAGGTDQGVFLSPTWPDEQTPGVPGLDSGQDYYVMLASTILDLKAGVYRMGVNSDDGFVVTYDDPRDVFAIQLASAGDRGQTTSLFDFVVQEDGFYPFQLIWWESTGGSECEWFIVDAKTGEQILVNDLAHFFQASPVKAYRTAPPRPYVKSISPIQGAASVATNTTIAVTLVDGAAKVVTNSIQLLLNGATLTPTITQASGVTTISATPPGVLPFLSSNNVTLVFSDNGTPALTRTNPWSFTVESSLPKVLFVVANPAALNPSDAAVKARLESVLGFEVAAVGDTASQTSDANRKALIVISSTVGSGNVNTKFRDVAVPILNWEAALEDDLLAAPLAGVTVANQTQIQIANATHPLAAGFPAGPLTVLNPAQSVSYTDPNANAIIIARLADPTVGNSPVIFVFPKGTDMEPDPTTGAPFKAPEKRVGFFLNNDTFANLTPEGLKLFDAAVQWTSGITNTASLQPKFDPPVLSGNQLTISWTGTGTFQEASNLTGNPADWSNVNPQPAGNTFTVTVGSASRKFYRIRQ